MSVMKKAGLSLLAVSLTFGLAAKPISAAPPDHVPDHVKEKHAKKKNQKQNPQFKDLHQAEWATKSILKMKGKGVFIGDGHGNFLPNKPITRTEAVVAAVRLMGLENDAKSRKNVTLHFKDAKQIDKQYGWAEGYIAVALENGLFDSNLDKFQPEKPATREWVATLLVRALGLQEEANAKMTEKLPFKDSKAISAGAVGFVAVAIEKGLITGYTDGTFQPNKPITRAEMAALLDRMDWMDDNFVSGLRGTVYIISPKLDEIIIRKKSGELVPIEVDDDIYIYLDGKPAALKDIKVGYQITVVFDEDGDVLLIDLRSKSDEKPVVEWISGSIVSVKLPTSKSNGTLDVYVNKEYKSFTLTNSTKVKADGLDLDLTDLSRDQEISLKADRDVIQEIKVKGTVREVEGTIVNIDTRKEQLTLKIGRNEVVYNLAEVVTYTQGSKKIKLSDLQVGDLVKVKTFDNTIKEVELKVVADTGKYTGIIDAFTLPTSTKDGSLKLYADKKVNTYILTQDTKVKSGDLNLHFSDVDVDQNVTITVKNSIISLIDIDGTVANFNGTVKGIELPTRNKTGSITLTRNGNDFTYRFATDLTATFNNKNIPLKEIQVGDKVELRTFDSNVKVIKVVEKYEEPWYDEEYKGSVTKFELPAKNKFGNLTIEVEKGKSESFYIDLDVKVTQDGKAKTLQDVESGDEIAVYLNKGRVIEIQIVKKAEKIDFDAEYKGELTLITLPTKNRVGLIQISNSKNRSFEFFLDSNVKVYDDGEEISLDDLEVGDELHLKVKKNTVVIIEVLD